MLKKIKGWFLEKGILKCKHNFILSRIYGTRSNHYIKCSKCHCKRGVNNMYAFDTLLATGTPLDDLREYTVSAIYDTPNNIQELSQVEYSIARHFRR